MKEIKETRANKLINNTIIFAIGNFATKFISFFLVPLYTNYLTTTEYGTIDFIYTICTIAIPIITLNIFEAIMRFSLDKDANIKKIISIGNTVIIATIILGLLIIPVLNFTKFADYSLLCYLYLITTAVSQIYLTVLKGQKKLKSYTAGNVVNTLLIAILNILFLVKYDLGINGYFLAYIISNGIIIVYAFVVGKLWQYLTKYEFDKKLFKDMTKYSVILIPNSFMWWIINSVDRIMITSYISTSANGIYAISYKIPTMLTTIMSVFTQAWLFSAIEEDESEDKKEYTNKVFELLFVIITTMSIILIAISKQFLKIYVAPEFYTAWKYMPYLLVGFVFLTMSTFISTSYNVNKDSKGFLKSGMLGAFCNIVLNAILIPLIGVSGAALATMISYIAIFIYRLIDTKKYVQIDIMKMKYFIMIILLITSATLIFIETPLIIAVQIIIILICIIINKNIWEIILKVGFNKMLRKK